MIRQFQIARRSKVKLETKLIAPREPNAEEAAHPIEVLHERLRNSFFVSFYLYIDDILRS